MAIFLSLAMGIGLSAAAGFRIFIPFLIMSIASNSGHLTLSKEFAWVGTTPALWTFAIATVIEIIAYFIPWVDNILDTIATPVAIIAGSLITSSMILHISPLLKWSLAIIAGGGTAAIIQSTTVVSRSTSSVTTAGIGNPIISFIEMIFSFILSILSLFIPIIAFIIVILAIIYGIIKIKEKFSKVKNRQKDAVEKPG